MFFTILLTGAVLASPQLSPTDKKFVAHIHNATSEMTDRKASFQRFDKLVSLEDALHCRRLQNRVPTTSKAYIELSFAQAYYGLDYGANLYRVTRPYRLWSTNPSRWSKEYPAMEGWDEIDVTMRFLNYLYLRHHDLDSLGTWLDLKLDGAAAESNSDELAELWRRHKHDMLLACDRHSKRIGSLTMALMFCNVVDHGETSPYTHHKAKLAATLQPFIASDDPDVSRPARALKLRILHNDFWRTD